jgi:hypothetical protein
VAYERETQITTPPGAHFKINQLTGDKSQPQAGDIFTVEAKGDTLNARQMQQRTAEEYIEEVVLNRLTGYKAKPVYSTVKDGNEKIDYVVESKTTS